MKLARVVADGDERTLSFKTNEVIFGGGRLTVSAKVIPLNYDEFMKVYEEANAKAVSGSKSSARPSTDTKPAEEETKATGGSRKGRKAKEEAPDNNPDTVGEIKEPEKVEETPEVDSSTQKVQEDEPTVEQTEPKPEAQPERKTRKRRGE